MQAGFLNDKALGYAQFAAGGVDASTLVSTATFGSAAGAGIPNGTQRILIQCAAQAIRWRDDGTAPTAAVGYPLAVGVDLVFTGNFANLRLIAQVAGAIVNLVAYG
jgi:hypothetical protein